MNCPNRIPTALGSICPILIIREEGEAPSDNFRRTDIPVCPVVAFVNIRRTDIPVCLSHLSYLSQLTGQTGMSVLLISNSGGVNHSAMYFPRAV